MKKTIELIAINVTLTLRIEPPDQNDKVRCYVEYEARPGYDGFGRRSRSLTPYSLARDTAEECVQAVMQYADTLDNELCGLRLDRDRAHQAMLRYAHSHGYVD